MELIQLQLPGFPDAPLAAALATDRGRIREHNEDSVGSFRPDPARPDTPVDLALVVADGVGGHEGGQRASRFVVDAVHDTLAAHSRPLDGLATWLDRLLQSIHQELLTQARARGEPSSMGSTATLAVIQDRHLWLAHVGDSRAYRLRNGSLEQLTEDDSWVAEQVRAGALRSDDPNAEARKNVLTQCLGIGGSLTVEIVEERLSPGDRYLLCSDGLHGLIADDELGAVLRQRFSPDEIAADLIDLANARGGTDNISAVVFDVGEVPAYASPAPDASPVTDAPQAASGPTDDVTAAGTPSPIPNRSRRAGNWIAASGAVLMVAAIGPWVLNAGGSDPVAPAATDAAPTVAVPAAADPTPSRLPVDTANAGPGAGPDTVTTSGSPEPDTLRSERSTDPDTTAANAAVVPDTTPSLPLQERSHD